MRITSSSGSKVPVEETCETVMLIAETEEEKKALACFNAMLSDPGITIADILRCLRVGASAIEACRSCGMIP